MKEEEEEKNLCKGCMLFSFFLLNTGTLPLFADGFFAFTKKKNDFDFEHTRLHKQPRNLPTMLSNSLTNDGWTVFFFVISP